MYKTLRSNGKLSYNKIEQMFEEHQEKWAEAIFNEDAWFKYIDPLIYDNNSSYLSMAQGSKAEQRKWWLYNRFRYIDSKYNAGDSLTDVITVRGYAKSNIDITPYADIYASVKYGSYLVQTRAARNNTYTLVCPLDNVNDTEIYIYSASQLKSVGDLSGLQVGYADFTSATKLQSLKLGDSSSSYSNGNLTELHLGNNVLLGTLDVRNCPALTQAVDISGCANIEHVYFEGTSITSISLPNGGILKTLHLPDTITNLTIRNQTAITDFSVANNNYSSITTLRLENVSDAIDSKEIVQDINANSRVRIIGFYWEADTAQEIRDLFDTLDTMRGLDEAGNNMPTAQLSGEIHIASISVRALADLNARYPYVSVTADETYTRTCTVKFYNGTTLLETVSVEEGDNAVYPGATPPSSYQGYFMGWEPNPVSVWSDMNCYAVFDFNEIREPDLKYLVYTVDNTNMTMTITGLNVSAIIADSLPYITIPDTIQGYHVILG